jgi:hypothetical protein
MLRRSPDTGICLHGGPFPSEGNLVCGEGAVVVGHLSASDSIKGTFREVSFTGEPER